MNRFLVVLEINLFQQSQELMLTGTRLIVED